MTGGLRVPVALLRRPGAAPREVRTPAVLDGLRIGGVRVDGDEALIDLEVEASGMDILIGRGELYHTIKTIRVQTRRTSVSFCNTLTNYVQASEGYRRNRGRGQSRRRTIEVLVNHKSAVTTLCHVVHLLV